MLTDSLTIQSFPVCSKFANNIKNTHSNTESTMHKHHDNGADILLGLLSHSMTKPWRNGSSDQGISNLVQTGVRMTNFDPSVSYKTRDIVGRG